MSCRGWASLLGLHKLPYLYYLPYKRRARSGIARAIMVAGFDGITDNSGRFEKNEVVAFGDEDE